MLTKQRSETFFVVLAFAMIPAILLFADDVQPDPTVKTLLKRIEKLERQVQKLEAELKAKPSIVVPTQLPQNTLPKLIPAPKQVPQNWVQKEFNGLPYYIVPLNQEQTNVEPQFQTMPAK